MTNKDLVLAWYERMWNRWDTSIHPDILHSDVKLRGSLGMTYGGPSGVAEYMAFVRAAFPDFHNRVELMIEEGPRVFAKLTYRATHRGPLFGMQATGRSIEYAGAAVFEIRDGKIADVWVLGDIHGLLKQLQQGADR